MPLLLIRSEQQSLMAHDECVYAVQARSILELGDWVNPGGDFPYDRTIGIQWLITLGYMLFGVSEGTARLPSFIASVVSVLLTYNIGCILLNQRLAWLGAAILGVTPLWVQYGRLATQDATLVCLELLGIWALLQTERQIKYRPYWAILAGATVGLGFLIKGFMIVPVTVALLPYLVWEHQRTRHLLNPWLYLGLILGAIPATAWLWLSVSRYGASPLQQLVGKVFVLGEHEYLGTTPFYYFWNIPANAFPWSLFAIVGVILVCRSAKFKLLLKTHHSFLLLVGYPIVLFIELTIFKTRTHYYPLQLFPFMALLAAVTFEWLLSIYTKQITRHKWVLATLSYGFGGLALLLVVLSVTVIFIHIPGVKSPQIYQFASIALALGLGWGMLLVVWRNRHQGRDLALSARKWLAAWLIGCWLALAMLGLTGLWGDYNSDLKTFLRQGAIASTLASHSTNFVVQNSMDSRNHKTRLVLRFYTPHLGQNWQQVSEIPPGGYAWVSPQLAVPPSSHYIIIGTIRGWQLIAGV